MRELGAPSAAWRGIAPSDMVTLTAVGAPETKSDIGDWASSADFEGFASPAIVGSWLHKLAAAKRARELENNASDMRDPAKSKTVLAQLRDVGLRYSLPTRETSLVGVSITPGATPSAPPIKGSKRP